MDTGTSKDPQTDEERLPTWPDPHPSSPMERRAIAAAMLGMLLDGYDLSIMAVVLLPLVPHWQLRPSQEGVLMAMALLGAFVGALMGGWLSDRWGRSRLLVPNILLYVLGAGLSALAPSLAGLDLGRLLTGLAIGLDYPLVATIVAEYGQRQHRGRGFVWINLAWFAGALASTVVGWLLLPLGADSWRWMLGSAVLPALSLLWLRRGLPESPRWLWRQGREGAARGALAILHPQWTPGEQSRRLASYAGVSVSWRALWHGPWRRRLFLAAVPWFLLDVVSLGIALYLPVVLRRSGLAASAQDAALINALLIGVSLLAMMAILSRIDRWGRLPLQVAGFASMALGLGIFAGGTQWHAPALVYVGATIYALGLGLGPAVTIFALAVELFPTPWRSTAAGMATAFSRLGAVASALAFPVLEKAWGIPWLLTATALLALLAALISRRFGIETRRLSLESLESAASPPKP